MEENMLVLTSEWLAATGKVPVDSEQFKTSVDIYMRV